MLEPTAVFSVTSDGRTERDLFVNVIGVSHAVHFMQGLPITPLSPPPAGLVLAYPSSKWKTIRSMLGFVILLFIVSNVSTSLIFAGLLDSDFDGDLGPSEPWYTLFGSLCLIPCVAGFAFFRRPRLTHIIRAQNSVFGNTFNMITPQTAIQTFEKVTVEHHLVRDTTPLEMPSGKQLWWLFFGGVFFSSVCMLPLLIMGLNLFTGVLFALVAIPAFIIGFSTPVFAWWSTSNTYFGLPTTRRLAEWMLIAGMISTLPAIAINSFLSPLILNGAGLDTSEATSLGFGLILMLSAPIGEELCKAAAVLALARFIDSPRRGFQIGFTVGLGFALLENSVYILGAFASGEEAAITFALTSVLRAISSIPGHGVWTGITGYAIGSYLSSRKQPLVFPGYQQSQFETTPANENWVLVDSSGHIMRHSVTEHMQPSMPPTWLSASPDKAISLPIQPLRALVFAMLLHSFWNGSIWGLSLVLKDAHIFIGLLVSIVWLSVLILALWQFTRHILPTALALESGFTGQRKESTFQGEDYPRD